MSTEAKQGDNVTLVSITVAMTTKHEVRAVRLLLKRLARCYGLQCVKLSKEDPK